MKILEDVRFNNISPNVPGPASDRNFDHDLMMKIGGDSGGSMGFL